MTTTITEKYGFADIFAPATDEENTLVEVVAADEVNKKVDGFYAETSHLPGKLEIKVFWDNEFLYTWFIELVETKNDEDTIKIAAEYGELMTGMPAPEYTIDVSHSDIDTYIEDFADKMREYLDEARYHYESSVSDLMLRHAAYTMEKWLASDEISSYLKETDVKEMWSTTDIAQTPTPKDDYFRLLVKVAEESTDVPSGVLAQFEDTAHVHNKLYMSREKAEKKLPKFYYDLIPVFGYVDNYEPITETFTIGFCSYYPGAECKDIPLWELEEYMTDQNMNCRKLSFHYS